MNDPRGIATTQPPAGRPLGGRYLLGPEVGRGGMAVVHRALDTVLDREVAVKLLHPHLATDPAFLERFRREARAAAGLGHPNVVAVHDWGEREEGAYLVLQLVDGVSLRDVLRVHRKLSPTEALAVLGPAAAGLAAAHDAGLVHRDIKPENLLIGRDGSVRVTDFGLARAAASATTTFGPEVLVGSPHYLAPEAVQGAPMDGRADVYALGILLYECLTGRPPHQAETPYTTAMAHVERAVPPPSAAGVAVPAALDALVLAATARDPARRTPDARSFARQLRAAVGSEHGTLPRVQDVTTAGRARAPVPIRPAAPTPPLGTAGTPPTPGRTMVVPVTEVHTQQVAPAPAPAPAGPAPGRGGRRGRTDPSAGNHTGTGRRRRWPVVVLLLIGLLASSAAAGYLIWDRILAPITPIPSVLGAPGDSALEQLERAGFAPVIDGGPTHDPGVPANHVLVQSPLGEARLGTPVLLVLSAGPRQVAIPELVDRPVTEAVAALTAASLEAEVRQRHDEEVAAGLVLATEPAAGDEVDEGATVTLTVSLGPTPILVPEVVGEGVEAARGALVELGLGLTVGERRFHPSVPAGEILEQRPAAGAVRYAEDIVEVVVSDGPQPVVLPNVRGERSADAVATLEALGLNVEVERRGGFSAFFNPDRVYDQDPGPGSSRLPGDTVRLYAYEP